MIKFIGDVLGLLCADFAVCCDERMNRVKKSFFCPAGVKYFNGGSVASSGKCIESTGSQMKSTLHLCIIIILIIE